MEAKPSAWLFSIIDAVYVNIFLPGATPGKNPFFHFLHENPSADLDDVTVFICNYSTK
jgi:hypothetical protein